MIRRKITLLKAEPRRTNVYSAFAYPGLALPVIGTVLKDKGYDVKIYVESIRGWDWSRIAESDLIGITVNSAEVQECYALADQIRCGSISPSSSPGQQRSRISAPIRSTPIPPRSESAAVSPHPTRPSPLRRTRISLRS